MVTMKMACDLDEWRFMSVGLQRHAKERRRIKIQQIGNFLSLKQLCRYFTEAKIKVPNIFYDVV